MIHQVPEPPKEASGTPGGPGIFSWEPLALSIPSVVGTTFRATSTQPALKNASAHSPRPFRARENIEPTHLPKFSFSSFCVRSNFPGITVLPPPPPPLSPSLLLLLLTKPVLAATTTTAASSSSNCTRQDAQQSSIRPTPTGKDFSDIAFGIRVGAGSTPHAQHV